MFRRPNQPATDPGAAAAASNERTGPNAETALLRDTARIEAFSDGVFAIAATLLVLDLHVPLPDLAEVQQVGLVAILLNQWPMYVAYVISFSFISIMWINHHNMFRMIRGADHTLLLLNGLLLLLIAVVPFPTSLLATYIGHPGEIAAAVVYSGTYFVIAIAFNLLWWHAAHGGRLLAHGYDPAAIEARSRRYRLGPLLYLLCTVLAFVSVPASLALNAVLAILFAWPESVRPPAAGTEE